MSHSWRRQWFSTRSFVASSRSGLVTPPALRAPPSRAAYRTRRQIACAIGSNSRRGRKSLGRSPEPDQPHRLRPELRRIGHPSRGLSDPSASSLGEGPRNRVNPADAVPPPDPPTGAIAARLQHGPWAERADDPPVHPGPHDYRVRGASAYEPRRWLTGGRLGGCGRSSNLFAACSHQSKGIRPSPPLTAARRRRCPACRRATTSGS